MEATVPPPDILNHAWRYGNIYRAINKYWCNAPSYIGTDKTRCGPLTKVMLGLYNVFIKTTVN